MVETIKFKAKITYKRYYSSESSWGVYGFSTEDDIPYFARPDLNEELPFEEDEYTKRKNQTLKFSTLAGKMQELIIGAEYIINATFKTDKKYGDQYVPISIKSIVPKTTDQQLLFLSTLTTEARAKAIINKYPNIVEDVASGKIVDINVKEIPGVGIATWNIIREKIINNYVVSDIIELLQPLGITYNTINKLLEGESNPEILKKEILENPYLITKIKGIGFKKCDDLALKLNPNLLKSKQRLVSFVTYYLKELGENDGHTWVSCNYLKEEVLNNVPECLNDFDWLVNESNEYFVVNNGKIGLKLYFDIESNILECILKKKSQDSIINIPDEVVNESIRLSEMEQGFNYTDEQVKTIKKALKSNISIIVGKAGVGKSSILRAIIKAYYANKNTVLSSALSAMAAQRIAEATGTDASTIHRTLGYNGKAFIHDSNNPVKADVMFLDEGSMVNAGLFLNWLNAIGDNTRIIICGDSKQLPPIGYGNIFSDLIDILDGSVVSSLTTVMRQAEMSGILHDANIIRDNTNPLSKEEGYPSKLVHGELKDMYYMFRDNRESLFSIAIKTYLKTANDLGINNVAVVVPRKENALNSAYEINKRIQEELLSDEKISIKNKDRMFKLGAKVLQTVNNYEKGVVNGQLGFITDITKDKDGNGKEIYVTTIEFADPKNNSTISVSYTQNELDEIDLGYALTCHKCVTKDTYIYTSNGICTINELNNGASVGELKTIDDKDILVFNGIDFEHPTNFYNAGVSKCKKIITKRKYELTATLDHGIDVLCEDGYIRRKNVSELTTDDHVVIVRGANVYGNNVVLPNYMDISDYEFDVRTKKYKCPKILTPELARFLGYMVADGVISNHGIKYGKNHKNVVEDFISTVSSIFEYNNPCKIKHLLKDGKYGGMFLTEISSMFIKKFCDNIPGIQPHNKFVPDIVLKAPKNIQLEFLRGVFEDGSVCIKNGIFEHISFTAKEELLINQINMMLLNIGICTTKYYKKSNSSYTLFMYGDDCNRFINEIGFISDVKRDKSLLYYNKLGNNCAGIRKPIPFVKNVILKVVEKYNIDIMKDLTSFGHIFNRDDITQNKINEFIEYCKLINIYDPDIQYLEYVANNIVIEKIVELNDCTEEAYCIEMPITHKFVQNGVQGWNCQGGSIHTVIGIIDNTHYTLLDNCMLYTLMTRAKKRCLLLAEPSAFRACIHKSHNRRNTWLSLVDKNKLNR